MPLKIEITTPFGKVYDDYADMIIVPAELGELGVLPGHTPYLASLTLGVLRIKKGEQTEYFAANGGFAEINPDRVVVLCETCERADKIDEARALAAKQRTSEQLHNSDQGSDLTQTELSFRKSVLRLKTVQQYKNLH